MQVLQVDSWKGYLHLLKIVTWQSICNTVRGNGVDDNSENID